MQKPALAYRPVSAGRLRPRAAERAQPAVPQHRRAAATACARCSSTTPAASTATRSADLIDRHLAAREGALAADRIVDVARAARSGGREPPAAAHRRAAPARLARRHAAQPGEAPHQGADPAAPEQSRVPAESLPAAISRSTSCASASTGSERAWGGFGDCGSSRWPSTSTGSTRRAPQGGLTQAARCPRPRLHFRTPFDRVWGPRPVVSYFRESNSRRCPLECRRACAPRHRGVRRCTRSRCWAPDRSATTSPTPRGAWVGR